MKKGFTIVELLIYMGILSVFLVILSNIFLSTLDVQLQTDAASSLQNDGRFILMRLAYDLHRASAASVPSASTLVLTIGGSTYTYALSGQFLQLTTPSGTANLNGFDTSITNLSFTLIGSTTPTIQTQFTISSQQANQSYQTSVSLRKP